MPTFHIGPSGSEELGVLFKGFTFIVIGEGDTILVEKRMYHQQH